MQTTVTQTYNLYMQFAMALFTARRTLGIKVLSVTQMSELPPKISKAPILLAIWNVALEWPRTECS